MQKTHLSMCFPQVSSLRIMRHFHKGCLINENDWNKDNQSFIGYGLIYFHFVQDVSWIYKMQQGTRINYYSHPQFTFLIAIRILINKQFVLPLSCKQILFNTQCYCQQHNVICRTTVKQTGIISPESLSRDRCNLL